MSEEEINRVIAEFMGWCEGHSRLTKLDYTKSLDALVPVVEKLKARYEMSYSKIECKPELDDYFRPNYYCNLQHDVGHYYGDHTFKPWRVFEGANSPSMALATAVAKTIMEIKE